MVKIKNKKSESANKIAGCKSHVRVKPNHILWSTKNKGRKAVIQNVRTAIAFKVNIKALK